MAESCEFTRDGAVFSTAYFHRQVDAALSQPDGRWADWLFRPGSFVDETITLEGTRPGLPAARSNTGQSTDAPLTGARLTGLLPR